MSIQKSALSQNKKNIISRENPTFPYKKSGFPWCSLHTLVSMMIRYRKRGIPFTWKLYCKSLQTETNSTACIITWENTGKIYHGHEPSKEKLSAWSQNDFPQYVLTLASLLKIRLHWSTDWTIGINISSMEGQLSIQTPKTLIRLHLTKR